MTMSAELVIRDARPADHAEVAALTLRAYRALSRPMSADYEPILADVAARVAAGAQVLVAEHEGRVVGSVTLTVGDSPYFEHRYAEDGDCGFRMLAVDPDHEGHGVGRALVGACLERAAEAGATRMVITSMPWMTRAHRLYRRFGFERAPALDRTYRSGTGVVFTRDLRATCGSTLGGPAPRSGDPRHADGAVPGGAPDRRAC